jgi:hypothetical protein
VGGGSIVVLTPWAELTHKHTPLPSPTPAEGIAERVRAYRHAAVAHGTPGLPAELASLEAAVASLQQRLLSSWGGGVSTGLNHGQTRRKDSQLYSRMVLKLAAGALALLAAPAVAHPWYVQSNPNGASWKLHAPHGNQRC